MERRNDTLPAQLILNSDSLCLCNWISHSWMPPAYAQRAGNFLVAREEMPDFKWEDLKGKDVLGGRMGGIPEMVFEYVPL